MTTEDKLKIFSIYKVGDIISIGGGAVFLIILIFCSSLIGIGFLLGRI